MEIVGLRKSTEKQEKPFWYSESSSKVQNIFDTGYEIFEGLKVIVATTKSYKEICKSPYLRGTRARDSVHLSKKNIIAAAGASNRFESPKDYPNLHKEFTEWERQLNRLLLQRKITGVPKSKTRLESELVEKNSRIKEFEKMLLESCYTEIFEKDYLSSSSLQHSKIQSLEITLEEKNREIFELKRDVSVMRAEIASTVKDISQLRKLQLENKRLIKEVAELRTTLSLDSTR